MSTQAGVVVLLDVDGVVNPLGSARPGTVARRLRVDLRTGERVRRLTRLAEVVWVTSWDAATRATLADTLGLPQLRTVDPGGASIEQPSRSPNLSAVATWLTANSPQGGWWGVAWIDDVLQGDAAEWARERSFPTRLVRPHPVEGLQDLHVDLVAEFVAGIDSAPTAQG